VTLCAAAQKKPEMPPAKKKPRSTGRAQAGSDWNKNFDLKKSLKIWQAAELGSGRR
jgi:hypothetical protein